VIVSESCRGERFANYRTDPDPGLNQAPFLV